MKRVLAVMLTLAMLLAIAGCTGDTGVSSSQGGGDSSITPSSEPESQPSSRVEEPSEPVDIRYVGFTFSNAPADLQKVLDEFNEKYATPLCNVRLNMEIVNVGSWAQTLNIMLASGEEFDVFPAFQCVASQLYSVGQIQSLQPAMESHGKNLMEIIPEKTMEAMSVGGNIIGIANVDRSMGSAQGLFYRKDLCAKYKFDESKLNNVEYLEECLKVIKENEPSIQYPIIANQQYSAYVQGMFENHYTLPDANYQGIGTVLEGEEGYKVYNSYATEEFAETCRLLHKWYNAGYLNSNAAITGDDETQSYFKNGLAFGYFNMYYPDTAAKLSTNYPGLDVGAIPMVYNYTATGDYQVFSICVPTASKKADSVVKLWDMLYSNIDACNLLCWGIEGEHYEKTGKDDREIRYPEGTDALNSPYSGMASASFGQYYSGLYMEGTPENMKELTEEFNAVVPQSKIAGFFFDPANTNTEFAAVSAVIDEYIPNLANGAVDPDEVLPKFLSALEQAGVQTCMDELQRQLEEWATTKK